MKLFIFLLQFTILLPLFGGQELDVRNKRKNFDKNHLFLIDLGVQFDHPQFKEGLIALEEQSRKIDAISKTGKAKDLRKEVEVGESLLRKVQKDTASILKIGAEELIQMYAGKESLAQSHPEEKPSQNDHWAGKEKKVRYFLQAKEEKEQAEKFFRDGNLAYAVRLFKRSISYSLSALKMAAVPIPEKYSKFPPPGNKLPVRHKN